ncbi:MAG: cytochrome b/b6 domain-containing protein, partial [Thalassobaculaceae bacterium]|nr:cytochrome b/b6 domain-containing protein [Thalassobaculaceae bacterium]
YGALTKLFHWLIVLLFAWQYVAGHIMTSIEWGDVVLGLAQSDYYDWHKSLGLVALAIALLRLTNRRAGQLPAWAPTLTEAERRFTHRNEQLLYTAMFLMPVSGYVYVMAGGYGVQFFGQWPLPNPIGKVASLAFAAKWVHIVSSYALAASILGHLTVVLRHQVVKRDGLLWRMWPGRGA